jgi:hypothetical protein
MPALKDKAISLLGSATIDMKTAATTTIYTTPSGKVTRITYVVFRDPTASMAGGTSYNITNWVQAFDLSNITTANTGYGVLYAETSAAKKPAQYTEIAANTAVQLTVTTGTTAACNATIDVFGYTT